MARCFSKGTFFSKKRTWAATVTGIYAGRTAGHGLAPRVLNAAVEWMAGPFVTSRFCIPGCVLFYKSTFYLPREGLLLTSLRKVESLPPASARLSQSTPRAQQLLASTRGQTMLHRHSLFSLASDRCRQTRYPPRGWRRDESSVDKTEMKVCRYEQPGIGLLQPLLPQALHVPGPVRSGRRNIPTVYHSLLVPAKKTSESKRGEQPRGAYSSCRAQK